MIEFTQIDEIRVAEAPPETRVLKQYLLRG